MKVKYTSPLSGYRRYMIEADGVKYHLARDMAVLKLKELTGNVDAVDEVNRQFRVIRRAKRAIEKNGYFAIPVVG